MKLSPQQASSVIVDPSAYFGLLVYGDDGGLVRERSRQAVRAIVGNDQDPFRCIVLAREEHGRLRQEIGSRSLVGGRRAIRVEAATDSLAAVLEPLSSHYPETFLVLEAPSLNPRSKLRLLAERDARWGAVACYPETKAAIVAEFQRRCSDAGMGMTREAADFLATELAGDSARRRAELDKLLLFSAGSPEIDLDMALACCASRVEATLNEAASAALVGAATQ